MKIPIRTVVIFSDEIQIYRGSKCRIYPSAWNNKRKIKLIDALWDSGKVISCKESPLVPSWDKTYELK